MCSNFGSKKIGRIIVFGGTFNPIHKGHVSIVLNAVNKLKAHKAIIVPTNISPHKAIVNGASAEHRINMCRVATMEYGKIEVSDIEIERQGKSYTVDTLKALREKYKHEEIFFLMGEDMAGTFSNWKSPDEICKLCKICIVRRGNNKRTNIYRYARQIFCMGGEASIIDIPSIDISSTLVRERLLNNIDVSDLLPCKVLKYIKENGLYI